MSDGSKTDVLNFIVWLAIAAVGLISAYVTFGILQSTASGTSQGIVVGGAIAGAIVSWAVLTSVFLQVRTSSGELERLRRKVEELQQKVIRGAPHPSGFDIEVAERHRIVLARPREWEPRGGTILDLGEQLNFEEPLEKFPSVFTCNSYPLREGDPKFEDRYAEEISFAEAAQGDGSVQGFTYERLALGGEAAHIDSIKIIVRQYAEVRYRISPSSGRPEYSWSVISKNEYFGEIDTVIPSEVSIGSVGYVTVFGTGLRDGLIVTANGQPREVILTHPYRCLVKIEAEDTESLGEINIESRNTDIEVQNTSLVKLLVFQDEGSVLSESPPQDEELEMKVERPEDADWKTLYREIMRMRVLCQNEDLQTIYAFDFSSDTDEFTQSSALFNQVLDSIRFLS